MTAGFLRPVLVLPDSARAWPRERQRVVLLHELAHVARRDLGALLVAELTTAAYWFHPLAHVVARHLRRSAEEASDDLVLGNGTRASDYASHLVGIVRGLGSPEEMPVLAMARPSDLEERVRAILDPRRRRRAPSRLLTASLTAAGIAGALVLAAAVPGVARPAMAALPALDEPLLASGTATCAAPEVSTVKAATREETRRDERRARRQAGRKVRLGGCPRGQSQGERLGRVRARPGALRGRPLPRGGGGLPQGGGPRLSGRHRRLQRGLLVCAGRAKGRRLYVAEQVDGARLRRRILSSKGRRSRLPAQRPALRRAEEGGARREGGGKERRFGARRQALREAHGRGLEERRPLVRGGQGPPRCRAARALGEGVPLGGVARVSHGSVDVQRRVRARAGR